MRLNTQPFTRIATTWREHIATAKHFITNSQRLELLVILVVIYSIATLTIELEIDGTEEWGSFFYTSECFITLFFTLEFVIRWIASRRLACPLQPMAIVDLIAVLPFYLGFLIDLRTLRLLRVLRVLRVFKLYRYTNALQSILNACYRIRYEFGVIGLAVFTLAWIGAVAVYELERDAQPHVFGRLSDGIWCMVVTLTTVGYGDKVPITSGGKLVALVMMLCGLGLFGTFVSLVGSAFLEELRRNPRHDEFPWFGIITSTDSPEEPPKEFDAATVLQEIHAGQYESGGKQTNRDLRRLLLIACQRLESSGDSNQGTPPEKASKSRLPT